MVLDYEIEVTGTKVKFTTKNIDSEAKKALVPRSKRKSEVICGQSGSTLVYGDYVIIGDYLDNSDHWTFSSPSKAKAFAAKVTKAIEELVKKAKTVKKTEPKSFNIEDHFVYNFKFEPKGDVIFTVTTQSKLFTDFVKGDKNPESRVKSVHRPEMSGSDLFIKGDSLNKTTTRNFGNAKSAVEAINKYTEKLQRVIAAFTVHVVTESVKIKYPVKKFSGNPTPSGVSFLYDTGKKNIISIIKSGCSTKTVGLSYILRWEDCVYLTKTQAVKSVAELLADKIVPNTNDFSNCEFL